MIMMAGHDEMLWHLIEINGKLVLVKQMYPQFLERAGSAMELAEVVALVVSLVEKFARELAPAMYDWASLYLGALIADGDAYREVVPQRTSAAT